MPRFNRLAVNDILAQLAKRREMVMMKNESAGRRNPGGAEVKRQVEGQTAWQSMMPGLVVGHHAWGGPSAALLRGGAWCQPAGHGQEAFDGW